MHFHWSDENERGSEHSKSKTHFPMDVQLIHYKEEFGSYENAKNQPEGIAILSVFFQLHVEKNPKLNLLLPLIENVTVPFSETFLAAPFPLMNLLPVNTMRYYRYV